MADPLIEIGHIAQTNDKERAVKMLKNGLDPNFERGWALRLAARFGSHLVVRAFMQWGANPHLPGESGASALQLAVYSGLHWEDDSWEFLLSSCDSSQLADGAGVAIVFKQIPALRRILMTDRCNTNISTTLTGRTVEYLAKAYNLEQILNEVKTLTGKKTKQCLTPVMGTAGGPSRPLSSCQQRILSPSVAEFFEKTRHVAGTSGTLSPQNVLNVQFSPLLFRSPRPTTPP